MTRTQECGVRRGERETKVEAFGNLEFFQVWDEMCAGSGGSTVAVKSSGEEDLDR
jgi:hypothetical protein